MKNLILIFLLPILNQIAIGQAISSTKLSCGNEVTVTLREGDNEICVVEKTNIKLMAKVVKGKIAAWSAIKEDGSTVNFKSSKTNYEREKPKAGDSKKPSNPPTKQICNPFCVVVNGVKYCSDGCLAKYDNK
jgi:hypothetical protein